ncbi:MAG: 4Fe-4S binding protein, partial [Psychromonas sp.]|nr:4Fe-4S binding protein [Psychromonas sp.]
MIKTLIGIMMMKPKVHAIYFSPTRSTAKIVKNIAASISNDFEVHDITQESQCSLHIPEDEIAVIGVPSFSGRVPEIAKQRLAGMKANGAPVVLVCVYGNRAYEDTLLELNNICTDNGFVSISAGAFIAKHSIFSNVAQERPDNSDIKTARYFGEQSWQCLLRGKEKQLVLPGNYPYKERKSAPLKPVVNDKCNQCGKCASMCPVGAIDKNN